MQLPLKTKITLMTALLVLAAVAVCSWLYVAALARQIIGDARDEARLVAQQVFLQAQHALSDAANEGASPASDRPEDMRKYVRDVFDRDSGLTSLIEAEVSSSRVVYEVTVVDRNGTALISSDASLTGRRVLPRMPLEGLEQSGFVEQLRALSDPLAAYQVTFPFKLSGEGEAFGEIRVAAQIGTLKQELLRPLQSAAVLGLITVVLSTLLAAFVSNAFLAPLARISEQLDRFSAGEYELGSRIAADLGGRRDEFGRVSTKINQIGQQLRGVREIFSALQDNLKQFMSGVEEGQILFSPEGRAVMVSSAVEKFLGVRSDELLGQTIEAVFPEGHAFRDVLHIDLRGIRPMAAAEAEIDGADGVRRVALQVQPTTEGGALVTLRDLGSLELLFSQLHVSEQMAALGRVTRGVAHEVKNPLNSMRLWLENLKESLPTQQELPQQALKVLDSEIDRLDRVLKTFLDFMRPVELQREPTPLAEVITEVLAVARPQIERARVEATAELAGSIPPVNADRQLLKQAILNLVLNAVEAMPGGGKLKVTLARRGNSAEVSVADNGRGIPGKYRARVFQLFFTTRPGGSGIGLASAYKIVQQHNGSIDFETEEGRGTTFRIELPLAG
jgi:PAS domain S-box-containing protein